MIQRGASGGYVKGPTGENSRKPCAPTCPSACLAGAVFSASMSGLSMAFDTSYELDDPDHDPHTAYIRDVDDPSVYSDFSTGSLGMMDSDCKLAGGAGPLDDMGNVVDGAGEDFGFISSVWVSAGRLYYAVWTGPTASGDPWPMAKGLILFYGSVAITDCCGVVTIDNELASGDLGTDFAATGSVTRPCVVAGYGGTLTVTMSGDACTYRQARKCSDNSLADVWMSVPNANSIGTQSFRLSAFMDCYFFNQPTMGTPHPDEDTTPGTLYLPIGVSLYTSCTACRCDCGTTCCGKCYPDSHITFGTLNGSKPCTKTVTLSSMSICTRCAASGAGRWVKLVAPTATAINDTFDLDSQNTCGTPCRWQKTFAGKVHWEAYDNDACSGTPIDSGADALRVTADLDFGPDGSSTGDYFVDADWITSGGTAVSLFHTVRSPGNGPASTPDPFSTGSSSNAPANACPGAFVGGGTASVS